MPLLFVSALIKCIKCSTKPYIIYICLFEIQLLKTKLTKNLLLPLSSSQGFTSDSLSGTIPTLQSPLLGHPLRALRLASPPTSHPHVPRNRCPGGTAGDRSQDPQCPCVAWRYFHCADLTLLIHSMLIVHTCHLHHAARVPVEMLS